MNLIDLITGQAGTQATEQAHNKYGVEKNQILALMVMAAPLIISYLKNKAEKQPEEAEKLNATLEKNHDGSILQQPEQLAEREQEGDSILNHIFGDKKPAVENELAAKTGLSAGKVGGILAMLAPLIMGYIGNQKRANNVGSGGITDLLGGLLGGNSSGSGNILADLISGVTQNQGTQAQAGGIGDILGGFLGGDNHAKSSQGRGGLDDLLGGLFK